MKRPKHWRTLLAGLALIFISNAVVLAMTTYNRLGEPDSQVQLTERELWLPPARGLDKENSGITLMLRYRVKGARDAPYFKGMDMDEQEPWLDRDKLTTLGFDLGSLPSADDKRARYTAWATRREAILVLEYDGDAYREAVARVERQLAEEEAASLPADTSESRPSSLRERLHVRLNTLRTSETRLYIIDVGLDRAALRQRYADGSRYLLMKGTVGLSLTWANDEKRELHGVIHNVLLDRIHVPSSYRAPLQPFLGGDRSWRLDGPPRYTVAFNLGQRLEPWVSGITALSGGD